MKWTTTLPKNLRRIAIILAGFITLTLINLKSYGQLQNQRVYADKQTSSPDEYLLLLIRAGYVDQAARAVDNDPYTFSTLNSTVVNIAGLAVGGKASQTLEFTTAGNKPTATTPVSVKIGTGTSLLGLVDGITVQATLAGTPVGTAYTGNTLLTLLSGTNQSEITFTPNVLYDGVRVSLNPQGALLSVGLFSSMQIYHAYFQKPATGSMACNTNAIDDLYGVNSLGIASFLGSVNNHLQAFDGNENTFSTLNASVQVAGYTQQTVIFSGPTIAGDSVRLLISAPSALLEVNLLNSFSIETLNGNVSNGVINGTGSAINLRLLAGAGNRAIVSFPINAPFDRVQLRLGGTASVLAVLNLHEVTRTIPTTVNINGTTANTAETCFGSPAALSITSPQAQTVYTWYTQAVGGVGVTGTTYTPTNLVAGANKFYVEASRTGCTNVSARREITINVNPAIVFPTTTLNNAALTFAYSKQINPATGGTPAFTYTAITALPAGLTLSPTGSITGTPTAPAGNYTFSIIATDSKGCTATNVYNLTITDALSLPAATLPNGTVDLTYPSQTIPEAIGGTSPYTYTASNLPPGLTFTPGTRTITGIPTQVGTYVVRVTATDNTGNMVFADYTIVVKDPLVLPPATLADGTVGTPYPVQIIPAATGGTSPYTYAATNLPPGLIFNASTREVSGTPTQAGPYTISVTATDAELQTVTNTYAMNVKAALVLPSATLADGNVAVAYASQPLPAATGGTGPYTYTALTTSLPPGLNFITSTRVISGTPTQSGLYSVSITAADNAGASVTTTYSLRVIGALSLPAMTLPDGTVGSPYPTQTLPEVSGGTAPYTYAATNLPPGLTFNTTTRQLSGTPTTGGSFTLSLTANDANSNSTTTNYTVQVRVGAPVVAAASICSGSTATLTVSNPLDGVTYNWYPETGNTALVTGATSFTTPALSTNTTYYVEAVSGTAVSSRTAVLVTVRQIPAPANVTANEIISSGQTATLQATAASGNTISWYAAASGGSSLATGGTFTTPPLTSTTTYYVETQNASGCVSAARVPVTVTVIAGPSNPNCNAATGQQTGIDGFCLLCGVEGAENSTDADLNNFTKINLVLGLGATGYQRLIFQNPGVATDSIRLDLETPVGLADVGVLDGITVRVMNGTTVVSTHPLNTSQINIRLLTAQRFKATFAAGGVYDRVEVRFGGPASVLSNLNIYGAEVIYPNPTVAAAGQTTCAGNSTTLTATANGGTTLRWYDAPVAGTIVGNGETFNTLALAATTTYYIEVSKGTCANVERIPVTVTVTPAPAAPVVAPVAQVCYGTAAVLSVDNPVTGLTYNWYTLATGGTSVFTGPSFTTPALTANTTYYVESSSVGCGSSVRTAVPVTVTPALALPQIQASSTTINPGQTVVLTASSTDADVTFNWYNAAGATTPIYVGPTYVTPPLNTTTTFYLEAKSNTTGCVTATRVQVTINVNTGGVPNPVPCEAPTAQTNGVTGVALLAGVFNPELAIDNDTQTASSLVMPVGLLGASVFQKLSFGSLSSIGDTVKVLLSAPGKLLSLGLLADITIGTYNGLTSNNDGTVINNNTIQLQLLSGNTQALISFVPTAQFDQVEVRLNGGTASLLSTIDVNYAQRIIMAPKLVSQNVTICATQTATLQINNPNPALTYKWYDATGATLLAQGTSYTTGPLSVNTKFLVEASSASGCVSYKTQANVTVTPVPDAPVLLADNISTCAGSSVVLTVGNPQPGFTYIWKTGATVLQTSTLSTYTIAAVTASATYTVTAQSTCGVASAETTATVGVGTPTPPVITPSAITINQGERAVLTATSSTAAATFTWYDRDPTLPGAVVVSTDAAFLTPPLTITTTYWVTSTSGACASAATSVVVTVNPPGSQLDVPCEAATGQENGTGGIASVFAGVDNPNQVFDNNVNTGSSLRIPVGVGSFVYQRAIFTGLSTIGDKVRIKLVSPNTMLSLALMPSVEITTYNGATSNGDTQTLNNPAILLDILPGDREAIIEFTPASKFDRVEVKLNSGLLGALTSINFNYAQRILIAPQVDAATASACVGSAATLNVLNPVTDGTITYNWYKGTDNTVVGTGATYLTMTDLTPGTYDFFVAAVRNSCVSAKTKVTVTILPAPDAPVEITGNPKTTCANVAVMLAVTQVPGVTYKWYDAATGGNVLAINTSVYTTPASLIPGVYNYYVEAVNGNSCTNTTGRTQITLTVNPPATAADINVAGAENPFCAGATATLTATSTTVTIPVFTWYSDAALTNAVHTGNIYAPVITATTTFYVTVSGSNKCENTAANAKVVTVTVNPPALASDIRVTGADAPFCAGSKATLNASSTTVLNPVFTWYNDAALTDPAFVGPLFEPTVTATKTYYVTVRGSNKCENAAADAKLVTLTVNPPATAADINVTGADAKFCAGTKAQLIASSTTVTNPVFTWYSDPGLTNAVYTGMVYEPVVTLTTTFYVTVRGSNKCENTAGNAKVITLTVNPPASASDFTVTGAEAPFCAGSSAKLNAASTVVINPVFTWYTDAALSNAVHTGAEYNTSMLTATTTFYVTVRGDNRCENTPATAKVVTLTVNPTATAADITVTGAAGPFCAGVQLNLTASSTTVSAPIFTWYSDAALTQVASVGPVFTPSPTATTTYYVTVRGSNKCENKIGDAKVITIIINTPAVAADIVVAGADLPFCAGSAVSLSASSTTVTNPIFTWYTDPGLTNPIFTGAVLNRTLNTTTTYYVTVKGANKCENAPGTARVVTVTINPIPDVPIITNSGGASICSGNATLLTVQNAQSGVIYQWYSAAIGGTLLHTGAQYPTDILSTTTDFFVFAVSSSGCGSTTGRVKVTVVVATTPLTPSVVSAAVNTCMGSTAVLSVSNPQTGITYNWYDAPIGGTLLGSGDNYTTPAITGTRTFYVGASSASCTSTSRTAVVVTASALPAAPPSVAGATNPLCTSTGAVLTVNNPDPALTYRWYSVQTGGTFLAEGNSYTTGNLTTTTTFYVASINKTTSCTSTERTAVTVTILAKLTAPAVSIQSVTATSVTFAWPAVAGATAYEVSIDGGITWIAPSSGAAGTSHLVAGLKPDQSVTIRVRAKGQLDCQLSDATTLTGKADNPMGNEVFIPNTFTPNNDGQNDVFYVYATSIAKMKLRIYNQWGQFIYESSSITNGWDGTYRGALQPNGVYVYLLEAEFTDGTKTTKKGTITLLR